MIFTFLFYFCYFFIMYISNFLKSYFILFYHLFYHLFDHLFNQLYKSMINWFIFIHALLIPLPENRCLYSSGLVTNNLTLCDEWDRESDLVAFLKQSQNGLRVVSSVQSADEFLIGSIQIQFQNSVDLGRERRREGLETN